MLEFFVAEVTARTAANMLGLHPNTAALFYHKLRQIIWGQLEATFPEPAEFEADESYFGGRRKGKRGRGAAGKVPVFGILKRRGNVYTKVIANAKRQTLLPLIQATIKPDSIVYTDSLPSYNALDVSDFKHYRINHSQTYVRGKTHINGIENFWNQAKRILRKYNGIPKHHFPFFLKECEFRFNYGSPKQQLKTLKRWCKL